MRVLRIITCVCLMVGLSPASDATAAVEPTLVISQVQTGPSEAATQEFVEIFNNSANDIDITGWCVTYSSGNDGTPSTLGCFNSPEPSVKLWLAKNSYALLTSPDFEAAAQHKGDLTFQYLGGLSGTAGHLRLLDAAKSEIDKVGWGTAIAAEVSPAQKPSGGLALQRKTTSEVTLQDTNNNAEDFALGEMAVKASGLFEVETVIDLCPNIDGLQTSLPSGYMNDESGDCRYDQCQNLTGLQTEVPVGYEIDGMGGCMQPDVCDNLDGIQTEIPDGFIRKNSNDCGLELAPLQITELLANASGVDTGKEFIELYNPTNEVIDLAPYVIVIGVGEDKSYSFPSGSKIGAGEYVAFYDSAMKFTLVNSSSRITLKGIDGFTIDRTDSYENPADDMAWALIDGSWQYTNQLTPGAANQAMMEEAAATVKGSELAPCPTGKYRHPLTNRCRNIETDAVVLAACAADQYRNPETNRCRKIAAGSTLTPCKDGQYRSEETNRCRNISAAASSLVPCKENQERNPETNRCRNVANPSVPAAAYAVEPVKDGVASFAGWWALGGVGILALGYAGWEWRREMRALLSKFSAILTRK